jgi:acetoacetyl-CoA synthetase
VVSQLAEVEKVVVIPFVHKQEDIDLSGLKNAVFLEDFLRSGLDEDGTVPPLQYEQASGRQM